MYIFLVTSQVRRLKGRQIQLIILLYNENLRIFCISGFTMTKLSEKKSPERKMSLTEKTVKTSFMIGVAGCISLQFELLT